VVKIFLRFETESMMSLLRITVPLGTTNLDLLGQLAQDMIPGAIEALFCSDVSAADIRVEVNESANRAPLLSFFLLDLSPLELEHLPTLVSMHLCLAVALAEEFVSDYRSATVWAREGTSGAPAAEWLTPQVEDGQVQPVIPIHPDTLLSLMRTVRARNRGGERPLIYLRGCLREMAKKMAALQAT
jgi:hypothetical protein